MIVVTTPTGQIGSKVLEPLLDVQEPVRVIVRDPARLAERVRANVEIVEGSHDNADVLAAALAGADTLLWVVPPDPQAKDPLQHYLKFTAPARHAIVSEGVARVVSVSSLGRGYGKDAGLLTPAFAMDESLESTNVAYRSLAMPYFMENLLNQVRSITGQGVITMANDVNRPLATTASRDIASAAVELLLDRSWSGQEVVPVVGPDDLSPRQMARVIAEVLERDVAVRQAPRDAYAATMVQYGMSEGWARGLVDMAAAQDDGIYDAEVRAAPTRTPTSFRAWCHQVLRPAVAA